MKLKLFAAALALVTVAPAVADEYPAHRRHHHRHHYHVSYWPLPYEISYLHNYGPGLVPGTFAFYDGPTSRLCKQGASAYIGQDGRRHPCF
jgi:hypothetical protein